MHLRALRIAPSEVHALYYFSVTLHPPLLAGLHVSSRKLFPTDGLHDLSGAINPYTIALFLFRSGRMLRFRVRVTWCFLRRYITLFNRFTTAVPFRGQITWNWS